MLGMKGCSVTRASVKFRDPKAVNQFELLPAHVDGSEYVLILCHAMCSSHVAVLTVRAALRVCIAYEHISRGR